VSRGKAYDAVVVGGGIVGAATAYELASAGVSIALVDRRDRGWASNAGAGILSPETTWRTDRTWVEFAAECGAHYPRLVERLAADGGADAGYSRCGLLTVSTADGDEPWFGDLARLAIERAPSTVVEVDPADAAETVPVLRPLHRALWNPSAARVDGATLTAALLDASRRLGATVVEAEAHACSVAGDRITAVATTGGDLSAGALVIAGGAWSGELAGSLGVALPIRPVKGQIVHLRVDDPDLDPPSWPIVQPVLGHYLVPWPDRRVACGGTFEEGPDVDARVTAAGIHELLRECLKLAPGLGSSSLVEVRVGFRPFAADDLPVLGRLPGWANVFAATGHGADGLLGGPYSGAIVAAELLGRARALSSGARRALDEYSPERFAN
jgi:D-amino-acid dehydrogenase